MAGVHIASTFPEIDTEDGWPCAMMQGQRGDRHIRVREQSADAADRN